MSDGKQRRIDPAWRAVFAAIIVGAVAGAVAVYFTGGLPGNMSAPGTSSGAAAPSANRGAATADADTCAEKADRAKAVTAAATGQVAAMMPADPPQSLADLAFNSPDGKPMTIADRAGKTVLLNLWATWCAPCRAEMPALDALQKHAGGEDFEVIAVNVDTGDDIKPKKFLQETQVASLGFYRENTLGLFEDLKRRGLALGLPVTLLIDEEGCLLSNMNGPAEWSGDDARRLIDVARGS